MRSRWLWFFAVVSLLASVAFAQEPHLRTRLDGPPVLPLPAPFASRSAMLGSQRWIPVAQDTTDPNQQTVMLPVSSGITLFSVPLETESQLLSDLLPNLPTGSRVWVWDAFDQQFEEGFDQQLPFGKGAVLYVPSPTVITITGETNRAVETPVDMANGWNLIGVPYGFPLQRSWQTAYIAGAGLDFNDAVVAGDLEEPVYTLEGGGYTEVGANDSFQPMAAYWVYSHDAEMLELQPALLGLSELQGWALKQLGAFLVSQGGNYLLSLISPSPDAAVLAQLAQISQQIADVQATVSRIETQLTSFQDAMNQGVAKTAIAIVDQKFQDIRSNLQTYYDETGLSAETESYMWYQNAVAKAKGDPTHNPPIPPDPTDLRKITDAKKANFDKLVLETYDFRPQFNSMVNAIFPNCNWRTTDCSANTTGGVLDNYATTIVLDDKMGSNLENRCNAMIEYFNSILGLQKKCMDLINSTLEDAAINPAVPADAIYKKSPGAGESFRKDIYAPVIQQEVKKFRNVMERVLVGRLTMQGGVFVPPELADKVMPTVDLMAMRLLQEEPGVRIRVLVAPHMNPQDYYKLLPEVRKLPSGITGINTPVLAQTDGNPPPPFPASVIDGKWTTIAGTTLYDSWKRVGQRLTFVATRNWLMWRSISQVINFTPDNPTYGVNLLDQWNLMETPSKSPCPGWTGVVPCRTSSTKLTMVNDGSDPPKQVLFGSVVLATRATAKSVLVPQFPSDKNPYLLCGRDRITLAPNFIQVTNCSYNQFIPEGVYFDFGGTDDGSDRILGQWQMGMSYSVGNRASDAAGRAYMAFYKGNDRLDELDKRRQGSYATSPPKTLTWEKGTYNLDMQLYTPVTTSGYTVKPVFTLERKDVTITFPAPKPAP